MRPWAYYPPLAIVLLTAWLPGCNQDSPDEAAPPPLPVSVSLPLQREITDYADFTGRTAAVHAVQIRARVWGHLAAVHFTEGAEVKQGDLLFTIDQRSYRAALARAEADVAQADARLKPLLNDYARAQTLLSSRAISREELDKIA